MDIDDFSAERDALPDPGRDPVVAALRNLGYAGEPRVGLVVDGAMRFGKRRRARRLSIGGSVLAVVAIAAGSAWTTGRTEAPASRVHLGPGATALTRRLAQAVVQQLPHADVEEVRLPGHAGAESSALIVRDGAATAYLALTDQRWWTGVPRDACPPAAHRPPPDCRVSDFGGGTTAMTFAGRPGEANALGAYVTHDTGVRVTLTETAGVTDGTTTGPAADTAPGQAPDPAAPLPLDGGRLLAVALDPGWARLAHVVNRRQSEASVAPIVTLARALVPAGWTDTTPSGPSLQRTLRNARGEQVTLTFDKTYEGAVYLASIPSMDYCFVDNSSNCVVSRLPDGKQLLTFHNPGFGDGTIAMWVAEVRDPADDALIMASLAQTDAGPVPPIAMADLVAMADDPRWDAVS